MKITLDIEDGAVEEAIGKAIMQHLEWEAEEMVHDKIDKMIEQYIHEKDVREKVIKMIKEM